MALIGNISTLDDGADDDMETTFCDSAGWDWTNDGPTPCYEQVQAIDDMTRTIQLTI